MRSRTAIIFILLGAVLILSACALGVYYLYEDHRAKENAALILTMIEPSVEAAVYEPEDERTSPSQMEEDAQSTIRFEEDELDVIGILTLEKLDIRLPVLSEYRAQNLKITVCRYEGDYFAQSGKMVIAGHNYKSHFGKLSQMTEGDIVIFTNIYGNEYQYYVTDIIEIDGTDTDALVEGDWTLSLFTCAFDRTKRIVVRCR